jgi:hypothetical protein
MGTFGFIPKNLPKLLIDIGVEKHQLKYCICDIQKEIMETNISIWKLRCQKLFANNNI